MLKRVNVKNVYSFSARDDERSEEFSMIAGKVRGKKNHIYDKERLKLLKFAAIYGANASGKSNLVKAMDLMRNIILSGSPEGHAEKYCKVDPENKNKPSYFEIELMLCNKCYAYGFEVVLSQSRFISEWLVELNSDNTEKELFTRDIEAGLYSFSGELKRKGLKERLEVYADDISDNSSVLFLSIMNENKKNVNYKYKSATALNDVYAWIRDSLTIIYPDQPLTMYEYLSKSEQAEEICSFLSAFDTGITGFKIVNIDIDRILNGVSPTSQKEILRRKEDFSAIYKRGKSIPERFVVVIYKKNNLDYNRISFLASKKVGNSVQRNRARRLMKESYRHICTDIKQGYDIVIIARNSINGRKYDEVNRSVINAVKKGKLFIG